MFYRRKGDVNMEDSKTVTKTCFHCGDSYDVKDSDAKQPLYFCDKVCEDEQEHCNLWAD